MRSYIYIYIYVQIKYFLVVQRYIKISLSDTVWCLCWEQNTFYLNSDFTLFTTVYSVSVPLF